jgi:cyclophilin family peptidyl-prolyl cis-trans isomerase
MRYTRLRVWVIFVAVVAGIIFLLKYSSGGPGIYKSSSPITDSLLTASYPDLYNAISKREVSELKSFLSHEHQEVREQAWRALGNTPVDSLQQFIDLAKQQNSEVAWFGISNHNLTTDQLREFEQSWIDNPDYRSGIVRVLGRQGDEQSLDFLLDRLDAEETSSQYQFALAVGRLVRQFDVDRDEQIGIIQNAFDTENYETRRAYLYGWYRGDESRLTGIAQDTLFDRWQLMGTGISRKVDQYVNKILPGRTTYNMTIYYNGEQMLDHQAQLSYELATSIEKISLTDRNSLAAKILLTNANPHVQVRTLQSLAGKIDQGDDLSRYINESMITDETLDDIVWLQALQIVLDENPGIVADYRDRLETIPRENLYLWPKVLAIYEKTESTDRYLERIDSIISDEEPLSAMFALQRLNNFWEELQDREQTEDRIAQIRSATFKALELQDHRVAIMLQPIIEHEELFDSTDFNRINQSLLSFSLPEDTEVYQSYGSLYKNRFERQAEPIIDSLAALDYSPLNRSLAEAGWDVEMPEQFQTDFFSPDWKRLWELGRKPVLTLRTQKGIIEIQLNTLSAPVTVSMIDSLNRAEMYDDTPFHRVVPNFVIQGGDIERKDGSDGPDFVIPTEASEQEFVRGGVGIASAGTDTEGSQYFIMHQWKPHLNGSYTRFGKVIEGMDVVDEIVEGDKVLSTSWY